jgi:hypothetical protein
LSLLRKRRCARSRFFPAHPCSATNPAVLFVVFDEAQGLAEPKEEKPLQQLAWAMDAVSNCIIELRAEGLHVVPLFVGTFFQPLVKVGVSNARRVSIPMPLLKPTEVQKVLVQTFGLRPEQLADPVFRAVVAFCGGHARSLQCGASELRYALERGVLPLTPAAGGATFSAAEVEQRESALKRSMQSILESNTTAAEGLSHVDTAVRRGVLARIGFPMLDAMVPELAHHLGEPGGDRAGLQRE